MNRTNKSTPTALISINTTSELDYFVKEAELFYRRRGRKFLVGSATKLCYRISLNAMGYDVQRVHGAAVNAQTEFFYPEWIAKAISQGLLFARPIGVAKRA